MNKKHLKIGKVTLISLSIALATISIGTEAQTSEQGQQGPPSPDALFRKFDKDGDNRLSQSEIDGPLKDDFATIDTNGDGYITKQELESAPKPQGRGQDQRVGSQEGSQGQGRQGPPSPDALFRKFDKDGDNRLSQSEIDGPLKDDFSKVDTNGDGYITKQELENAPKPQGRGQGDR